LSKQSAEWLSAAQSGEHFDKLGSRKLEARTRDAKIILVIGNRAEFDRPGNPRDATIKRQALTQANTLLKQGFAKYVRPYKCKTVWVLAFDPPDTSLLPGPGQKRDMK